MGPAPMLLLLRNPITFCFILPITLIEGSMITADKACVFASWASYQIRKIVRCTCAGDVFPPPTSEETASWRSRHASRHVRHAHVVIHVGIANPRWREKRPRHSRCTRNPQFYGSGKRPIAALILSTAIAFWSGRFHMVWIIRHSQNCYHI